MSTMLELDKLLYGNPLTDSANASMASPDINFAGLTLQKLESFNSSVSGLSKGSKVDLSAISKELKEIMSWPINAPGDYIFLSGVEK